MDEHILRQPEKYIGTLRWGPSTVFPSLPPFSKPAPPLDGGWQPYFSSRLKALTGADGQLTLEPPIFDGLSYPLSFIWVFRQILLSSQWRDPIGYKSGRLLRLVLAGASQRTEQRLVQGTNYFGELAHYLPSLRVELILLGPEVEPDAVSPSEQHQTLPDNISVTTLKGRVRDVLPGLLTAKDAASELPPAIIVCAFNSGFASGDDRLRTDWAPDLDLFLRSNVLVIFTCANDWADLKGESAEWQQRKAHYALPPQKCPFRALTTVGDPATPGQWYCANSFVYAIQGVE